MMTASQREEATSERTPPARPPLVLIANDQEWSTRSLESILWPNGYAVLRAYTGRKALERASSAQPDLIIIDASLPDIDSLRLCEQLRADSAVRDSTPILMTAPVRPSRSQRLAALRAGAWDYLSYPLDAEELMLRLDGYMRAKFDADRARDDALLDERTGLYNLRGLERRARELGSHAFRNHWALACVVVAPDVEVNHDHTSSAEAVQQIADVFKSVFRISDAIGRLGESEFAIIAPGTDATGAVRLAKRLSTAINHDTPTDSPELRIRVGYDAVADYHENPVELMDMLARATTALRMSRSPQRDPTDAWIQPFEEQFELN
jgi:diguanylate cyclase (GGDEF)-like protein